MFDIVQIIIGVLIAAIGLLILWGYKSNKTSSPTSFQPIRHNPAPPNLCINAHVYRPIDVQPSTTSDHPTTMLLRRCFRCGQHDCEFYPGYWTIEQFCQVQANTLTEVAVLERMAR